MDFDSFASMLLERLDVEHPRVPIISATGLFDEVGLDSFQAFELLIVIETAAGLDVPPIDLPVILTMGDAYAYYQQSKASSTLEPT